MPYNNLFPPNPHPRSHHTGSTLFWDACDHERLASNPDVGHVVSKRSVHATARERLFPGVPAVAGQQALAGKAHDPQQVVL